MTKAVLFDFGLSLLITAAIAFIVGYHLFFNGIFE
jgi:hypothetical protein